MKRKAVYELEIVWVEPEPDLMMYSHWSIRSVETGREIEIVVPGRRETFGKILSTEFAERVKSFVL